MIFGLYNSSKFHCTKKLELIKQITVYKGPHDILTRSNGKLLFVDVSSATKIAI
jgi:hypothetical protein